jgi:hypothetical protein
LDYFPANPQRQACAPLAVWGFFFANFILHLDDTEEHVEEQGGGKQRQSRLMLVPFLFQISIGEVNHGCCSKEKDKCFWNVLEMEVTVTMENRGQYSDDKGNNGRAPS